MYGDFVEPVRIVNMPSFLEVSGMSVECSDLGPLTIDVAYGGNFNALIEAQENYKGLESVTVDQLLQGRPVVRKRLNEQHTFVHPEDSTIRGLSRVEWAGPLGHELDLNVPVEPAKGYSITLEVGEGQPGDPYILTEDKVSVTPLPDGVVRFAGTLELAGFDPSADRHRIKPILDVPSGYVSEISRDDAHAVDPPVGFRPCTPNGLPSVGPVSKYDNLAIGHCMLGVSLAPVTGQLVAKIVTGQTPSVDIAPLRLERLHD